MLITTLTHLDLAASPVLNKCSSQIGDKGVSDLVILSFKSYFRRKIICLMKSVQTLIRRRSFAASHLGLHDLSMLHILRNQVPRL